MFGGWKESSADLMFMAKIDSPAISKNVCVVDMPIQEKRFAKFHFHSWRDNDSAMLFRRYQITDEDGRKLVWVFKRFWNLGNDVRPNVSVFGGSATVISDSYSQSSGPEVRAVRVNRDISTQLLLGVIAHLSHGIHRGRSIVLSGFNELSCIQNGSFHQPQLPEEIGELKERYQQQPTSKPKINAAVPREVFEGETNTLRDPNVWRFLFFLFLGLICAGFGGYRAALANCGPHLISMLALVFLAFLFLTLAVWWR